VRFDGAVVRKRERALRKLLSMAAQLEGGRLVTLESTNNGHYRAIVLKNGETFRFYASSTTCNWEGDKNLTAL
jgi:hypothetical protein